MIRSSEIVFRHQDDDLTASFEAFANIPARLQVWLHDPNVEGRVEAVDVRMFLQDLNLRTDTMPEDFNSMRSYAPGAKTIEAHLRTVAGWTWRYRTIEGRRVAVPVST